MRCAAVVFALLAGVIGLRGQEPDGNRAKDPLRAAYMRAHFEQTMAVHDAIVRGDLQTARTQAAILAERSPLVPMPVGAEAFHGAFTRTARQAATAATLAQAAQATASVLGLCGQCHRAMRVTADVPRDGAPATADGPGGHMQVHHEAATALIEGLVAPSESRWASGVRLFATPRVDEAQVPARMRRTMRDAEAALATLAGRATQAQRTRDRTDVYGRMLATCGECHARTRR
mgnify:CR=1 FL=1